MESKANNGMVNYHQSQIAGEDQMIIVDQHITGETDELDPVFHQQGPPIDPEDEDDEPEEEDEDDFPAREDLEDDDLDLEQDDDFDLDDEAFK